MVEDNYERGGGWAAISEAFLYARTGNRPADWENPLTHRAMRSASIALARFSHGGLSPNQACEFSVHCIYNVIHASTQICPGVS